MISIITTSTRTPRSFSTPRRGQTRLPEPTATSKPYYGDYRSPRYPSEQLGFGKVIPFKEGVSFSLRADFFNVFNRWAYPNLNNTSNPSRPLNITATEALPTDSVSSETASPAQAETSLRELASLSRESSSKRQFN